MTTDTYDPTTAFKDVVVESQADVENQFNDSILPPYDLAEIELSDLDIDMVKIVGVPNMLKTSLWNLWFQCFGNYVSNAKKINGYICLCLEPWQLYIQEQHAWELGLIVRSEVEHYPPGGDKPTNQLTSNIQVSGEELVRYLNTAGVQNVIAYKYGMKDHSLQRVAEIIADFRKDDPNCKVWFDVGYRIIPQCLSPGVHSTVVASFNQDAAKR